MIEKLASKLGRKDELPNIELAELLCKSEDEAGINEIVNGLKNKERAIANDCIKVLYEIGARKPQLISDYTNDFISLLASRNNQLAWRSMRALSTIAEIAADVIYARINEVLSAYRSGSVTTVDNSITVLAKLCSADKEYENHIFPLLINHLQSCKPTEIAQHGERISICIHEGNEEAFFDALEVRKVQLSATQSERIRRLERKLKKSKETKIVSTK